MSVFEVVDFATKNALFFMFLGAAPGSASVTVSLEGKKPTAKVDVSARAFKKKKKLKRVALPDGLEEIGKSLPPM